MTRFCFWCFLIATAHMPALCLESCQQAVSGATLTLIISKLPKEIRDDVVQGKYGSAISFTDKKSYSFASGGIKLSYHLWFIKTISDNVNVTLEMVSPRALVNSPGVTILCSLKCESNTVVCDAPNIKNLLPAFKIEQTNRPVLAATFNYKRECVGPFEDSNWPVDLCFDVKIQGTPIAFLGPSVSGALLQTDPTGTMPSVDIEKSHIGITKLLVYYPDPIVQMIERVADKVIVVKGLGLKTVMGDGDYISVTLSVPGVYGQVSCELIDETDQLYQKFVNKISSNETGIICHIYDLNKLLELTKNGHAQVNSATSEYFVPVVTTLSYGAWTGNASFQLYLGEYKSHFAISHLAFIVPIGFVVLVVVAFVICCCVLAKGTSKEIVASADSVRTCCPVAAICLGSQTKHSENGVVLSKRAPFFSPDLLSPETNAIISSKRLELSSVTIGEEIGAGHFGKVKRGTYVIENSRRRLEKPVAIKFIQNCTDETQLKEFFEEAKHMFGLNHPNILGAYGLIYDVEGSPALVLPLMDVGDLRRFVQSAADQLNDILIVDFAQQIADGMTYIANKNLIHRDLAARNCLLNKYRVVKIGDFGLSRLATSLDYEYTPLYESKNHKRHLPIRWMAPESIDTGNFNEKTDVWSYGILLWELAVRGLRPYADMQTPIEVIRFVCVGKGNLPQLCMVSDCLYALMKTCWNETPSERPTFLHLSRVTRTLLSSPNSPLFSQSSSISGQPSNLTETNPSSENEIKNLFYEALQAIQIKVPIDSAESRGSLPQHFPIPSRHNSSASTLRSPTTPTSATQF